MMKTVLMATAAILTMTGAASALDFGSTNLQLNSTIVAEYDTSVEEYTTTYTPELRYIPVEGLSVYAETDFDLQDIEFAGATIGAEYYPGVAKLDLVTYVKSTSDADFNFDGAIIGAELNF